MPFEITPSVGGAQETPAEFGTYIQFQLNGVDLGTATVTKVNFLTGTANPPDVTRGTGEEAGTLTVTLS